MSHSLTFLSLFSLSVSLCLSLSLSLSLSHAQELPKQLNTNLVPSNTLMYSLTVGRSEAQYHLHWAKVKMQAKLHSLQRRGDSASPPCLPLGAAVIELW